MEQIISEVYKLIKETNNLIELEAKIQQLMYNSFTTFLEIALSWIDQAIVQRKQKDGWKPIHKDNKMLYLTFGPVKIKRTLMRNKQGESVYPLDEFLGLRKYQRYSSLVEVKIAELASQATYRETARVLSEWTAVDVSHQTVGKIVKTVGEAQSRADEELVDDLEEAASLPEGRKVEFLVAEADGVFVRSTKRKKSIEVHHAVTHEGWKSNGKRVSLDNKHVILTTKSTDTFWSQVQATTAHRYSLEKTQVVTNSDGGNGYTADKFQEAFSQSEFKVLNQLDPYHISQAVSRTFGVKSEWKTKVNKAIKSHDIDQLKTYLDTYESTLEDTSKVEKLQALRSYIVGNWDRIFDWRDQVESPPDGARSLGAMESNQRLVSFRMKKRGMHWSPDGAEAMVKVKQGIINQTLRDAYLKQQQRSVRKQREVKQTVRMAQILRETNRPSIGAKHGQISLYGAHSSAMGQLAKSFR